jgi:hypothetical protein
MYTLSSLQTEIENLTHPSSAVNSTNTDLLQQILNELRVQNNKGQTYLYVSDVLTMDSSYTDESQALANPLLTVTTPPQNMLLDTLSIGWDNNAYTYYKYKWTFDSVFVANSNFVGFPKFTTSIDYFDSNKIPLLPNSNFNMYAYNYNSGTSSNEGTAEVYILGFLG